MALRPRTVADADDRSRDMSKILEHVDAELSGPVATTVRDFAPKREREAARVHPGPAPKLPIPEIGKTAAEDVRKATNNVAGELLRAANLLRDRGELLAHNIESFSAIALAVTGAIHSEAGANFVRQTPELTDGQHAADEAANPVEST